MQYGRRPPKNDPALMLADILTGVIPTHPSVLDYLARLSGWQMLGNDTKGDCVAVTWANERRLVSSQLGAHETYPTLNQVYAFYKTQNPGFPAEDNGMEIQTALEYLQKNGGPDGVKAVAFAKVDFTNLEEVKAAIAIFGCVWIGINVLKVNPQEFNQGQPWDYVPGSPVEGGHSIIGGGYQPQAASDVKIVTWAKETSFTDSFWAHQVEECWIVVWPEHLGTQAFQQGIDIAALASAYNALTGKALPIPSPSPTPAPVPPTTPYVIGQDIMAAMGQEADSPSGSEVFFKSPDGKDQFSDATGKSGKTYRFNTNNKTVAVYPPSKVYPARS